MKEYFPFWDKLTAAQQKIFLGMQKKKFPKGTLVHNGSEDCIGLLVVLSGRLRVYTIPDEGKEITLYRLLERDICLFSASCIMKSIQFDLAVEAEEDTEVLHIPAKTYKKLMEESAAVANYTSELMADRFSEVMWLMDQVMNKKMDSVWRLSCWRRASWRETANCRLLMNRLPVIWAASERWLPVCLNISIRKEWLS